MYTVRRHGGRQDRLLLGLHACGYDYFKPTIIYDQGQRHCTDILLLQRARLMYHLWYGRRHQSKWNRVRGRSDPIGKELHIHATAW